MNIVTPRRSIIAACVGSVLLCASARGAERPLSNAPALPMSGVPSALMIEEIVVTGTNIRGEQPAGAPLTILSREYIEASGVSSVTALLESLPQNFALANQSGVLTPGVSDARTQGAAINLRGLGEGTTLVLINGRRPALGFSGAAVDISALPLAAIERVEILKDGASALYGSDAVGGVVNFILRRDFSGVESRIQGGWADGVDEYDVSQLAGGSWDTGSILGSVQFHRRSLLETAERPDVVPANVLAGSLLPEDKNYSAMLTGRQYIGRVELFGDVLFTNRDTYNISGRTTLRERYETDADQLIGTLGASVALSDSWKAEIIGGYSEYAADQIQRSDTFMSFGPYMSDTEFASETARLKLDGPLLTLPGGVLFAAVGTEWRSESYVFTPTLAGGGNAGQSFDLDQEVNSAFGELKVPLVGEGNAMTGLQSLALSIAGRYDDYSTFGSSFDPKLGVSWNPVSAVEIRGSWSTAFVAPRLLDGSLSSSTVTSTYLPDPTSPTPTQQLVLRGTAVEDLKPQESENLSLGFAITPLKGPQISVDYFDIDYTDRIALPPAPITILNNPAAFGTLFVRNPTVDQVNQAIALGLRGGNPFVARNPNGTINSNFDPAAVDVIIDQRRRNLSETRTSGFDFSIQGDFAAGSSDFFWGLETTYILKLEGRVTATSDALDTVDTYNNPPHWRGRGALGWNFGGWQSNLFVNYTDSYLDNRVPATTSKVDSFTTVDLRVAYDFTNRFSGTVLSGLKVAAIGRNLFDEEPPSTRVYDPNRDLGFDTTNATALGALYGIEVVKTW